MKAVFRDQQAAAGLMSDIWTAKEQRARSERSQSLEEWQGRGNTVDCGEFWTRI